MEFKKKAQREKNLNVLNYFTILCWATFTAMLGYRDPVVEDVYRLVILSSELE